MYLFFIDLFAFHQSINQNIIYKTKCCRAESLHLQNYYLFVFIIIFFYETVS